jgi:predicted DNA-binding transcriptional regulator AlpA
MPKPTAYKSVAALLSTTADVKSAAANSNPAKQPNRNRPAYVGLRFLRLPAVLEFAGFGRTKLFEEIGLGRFPRPVRLVEGGRAIAWDETELIKWREGRLAARDRDAAR